MFSSVMKVLLGWKVASWTVEALKSVSTWQWDAFIKKAIYALSICSIAFGGAVVGTVMGAIHGSESETGFWRGAGIGAIAGATACIQIIGSIAADEPILSKVAKLSILFDNRVFAETVIPTLLVPYQWQVNEFDTLYGGYSDENGVRGLPLHFIQEIPRYRFKVTRLNPEEQHICSICLEDIREGDMVKKLPSCEHGFHLQCLDEWLTRSGSCPLCRQFSLPCDYVVM